MYICVPQINALCKVIPRQIKAEKAVNLIRQTVEELIAKCREIVETEGERINEEEYVNDTDPSILRFLLASREEVSKAFVQHVILILMDCLSCLFAVKFSLWQFFHICFISFELSLKPTD